MNITFQANPAEQWSFQRNVFTIAEKFWPNTTVGVVGTSVYSCPFIFKVYNGGMIEIQIGYHAIAEGDTLGVNMVWNII